MGWNNIYYDADNDDIIFFNINKGSYFYFKHSFFVKNTFSDQYINLSLYYSKANKTFISGIHYYIFFGLFIWKKVKKLE